VVGNICESGDVFARDRWLQQVREGDVLAVLDAGAYGMSMASTYNLRPLPAEVMVEADGSARLVTRRQSVAELVDALLEAG
jgi:diaminopimelate decarboxylase